MIVDMITDVPTRLIVAYALIALMVLAVAGVVWWQVRHSPRRVEEREQARRRAARQQLDQL